MKRKNKTHLILETRKVIEEELKMGTSISKIADMLDRNKSSILREIERYKILKLPSPYGGTCCCIHKDICKNRHYDCSSDCKRFELEICDKLKASPHVCNSCRNQMCKKAKFYYIAKDANEQYKQNLKKSRSKMHYSEIELNILNNDVYELMIITKSLYHSIKVINAKGYNFNRKSIYRQIKNGLLRLKASDLPRSKNSTTKKEEVDKNYKRDVTGHTYENYIEVIKNNPEIIEWQMDCVQGIIGSDEPVFLTLQIVKIKFLFIFIIKKQTNNEVIKKLKEFNDILKSDVLNKLIELLLTDNGHEFMTLEKIIEVLGTNQIYYCHPYSSYEKGSIENNHELIRRIIPQGVSLKEYTEEDVQIICSHINSLYREELNGKCPFDLINEYLTDNTINKLGYKKIKDDKVMLIPELLGTKNIENIKRYLNPQEIKKANIKFINNE